MTVNIQAAVIGKSPSFETLLSQRGLRRGSGSWLDYEVGKRLADLRANSAQEYDELLAILTRFLAL